MSENKTSIRTKSSTSLLTFPSHSFLRSLTSEMWKTCFLDIYAFVSVSHLKVLILSGSTRGQKPVRIWDRFIEKPIKHKVQSSSHAQSPSETLAEILVTLYLKFCFFIFVF